jgi:hypothetical protein
MQRYTFWISEPQIKKLEKRSKKEDVSVSELIRRGIDALPI